MWQSEAKCQGDTAWIMRGNNAAKIAVCKTCPVIQDCLTFAMRNEDYENIVYGGMTGTQRARLGRYTTW